MLFLEIAFRISIWPSGFFYKGCRVNCFSLLNSHNLDLWGRSTVAKHLASARKPGCWIQMQVPSFPTCEVEITVPTTKDIVRLNESKRLKQYLARRRAQEVLVIVILIIVLLFFVLPPSFLQWETEAQKCVVTLPRSHILVLPPWYISHQEGMSSLHLLLR